MAERKAAEERAVHILAGVPQCKSFPPHRPPRREYFLVWKDMGLKLAEEQGGYIHLSYAGYMLSKDALRAFCRSIGQR